MNHPLKKFSFNTPKKAGDVPSKPEQKSSQQRIREFRDRKQFNFLNPVGRSEK